MSKLRTIFETVLALVAIEVEQSLDERRKRKAAARAQVARDLEAQRLREVPWERRQREFYESKRRRAEADKRG